MVMPLNLVFVRHGESEGNVANRSSRAGDNSIFENPKFASRHSSTWRLSQKGREEATATGRVIRSLALNIGRKYSSPYFRAMETMALMSLGGPRTMFVYDLRERSWGELDRLPHEERRQRFGDNLKRREEDPFLWEPTGGESLASVITRARDFLSTLWRECGYMEAVVCASHAELMETVRVVIERKLPSDYVEMRGDKTQDIWNGSILHYTRQNPFDRGERPLDYLNWVRLITPPEAHSNGSTGFDWQEVTRPSFSDEEILRYLDRHVEPLLL